MRSRVFSVTNLCVAFRFVVAAAMGASFSESVLASDLPMPTKAATTEPAPAIESWTYSLTPYAWAPSLSGSMTVKGYTTDVAVSFTDLLEHTKIPKDLFELAAFGEARHGRFAILTDFTYLKVGLGAGGTRSRNLGGSLGPGVTIGASAGLNIEIFIAEVAAAYEVLRLSPVSALDLYAGGRLWRQTGDASLEVSSGGVNSSRSLSGSVNWIDPVVGARLRQQLAPHWNLVATGDVGGFDLGSKFSWQAYAAVTYEFAKAKNVTWSGMAGYKALYANYSQGTGLSQYEYDMTLYGPVFAITARF